MQRQWPVHRGKLWWPWVCSTWLPVFGRPELHIGSVFWPMHFAARSTGPNSFPLFSLPFLWKAHPKFLPFFKSFILCFSIGKGRKQHGANCLPSFLCRYLLEGWWIGCHTALENWPMFHLLKQLASITLFHGRTSSAENQQSSQSFLGMYMLHFLCYNWSCQYWKEKCVLLVVT